MSTENNKKIVVSFNEEIWNKGRLDRIGDFLAEDVVEHGAQQIPGLTRRDSIKTVIGGLRQAMPDVHFTTLDVVAEGDKVVMKWSMKATHQGEIMGAQGTGKPINHAGATFYRIANDKIVEIEGFADNLSLMQQLGLIPAPQTA
jgi:steroid delta-isomerase-like uncharacterized protein